MKDLFLKRTRGLARTVSMCLMVMGLAAMTLTLVIALPSPCYPGVKTVKTSYKQFSIYTYQNQAYLCEPYLVKKDDWLYKIFRKKGEISEKDFPFFLNVFKNINPDIRNIDAIIPGVTILIPLKKVDKEAYEQNAHGLVEVPVIEFSAVPDHFDLSSYVREHATQAGDTVSELMDKAFLTKGGDVTLEGKKLFSHLNPDVENIDQIQKGSRITIPDASILSQSWYQSFLKHGTTFMTGAKARSQVPDRLPVLPVVQKHRLQRLKRYAELIEGTLISQGKMHFPGKGTQPLVELDLSRTPIIDTQDGRKILLLPSDQPGNTFDKILLKSVKAYWKQLRVIEMDQAIQDLRQTARYDQKTALNNAVPMDKVISDLLGATGHTYVREEKFSFFVEDIEMSATLGRVVLRDRQDLVINPGRIYGLALESLEKQDFDVLTLSGKMPPMEVAAVLFKRLGYAIWKNPSFSAKGSVSIIQGLYGTRKEEKIVVSLDPLSPSIRDYFKTENILFLQLKK